MATTHTASPRSGAGRTVERSGWLVFAAVVLGVAGIMRIFDAIWAFRYDGALPDNLQKAIFGTSLNTYGWVYLGVAAVLILSGIFVMEGSQVARWTGVVAGAIGAISAVWWMPYYPVWSLVYVALGVLVVYGLIAHGARVPMGTSAMPTLPAQGTGETPTARTPQGRQTV